MTRGDPAAGRRGSSGEAPDAEVVPPSKPPTDSARAREGVRDAEELRPGESGGGFDAYTDLGGRTLSHLVSRHPFLRYFGRVADRQYASSLRPETRFGKLRKDSPRFYWTCLTLDMVLLFVALTVLVAMTARALYKSVWL